MRMIRVPVAWVGSLLVAVLLASTVLHASALAADEARAKLVKIWAYVTPEGGERRPLFERDRFVVPALVEAITEGALHIVLADGTELRLGSASRARLGAIRLSGADARIPIGLEQGAFRVITGAAPSAAFEIESPTARLRILGTNIIVIVASDGATEVSVYQGRVAVAPRASDATYEVMPGRGLAVAASGVVSEGAALKRGDSGLNRRGGKGRRHGGGPAPGGGGAR